MRLPATQVPVSEAGSSAQAVIAPARAEATSSVARTTVAGGPREQSTAGILVARRMGILILGLRRCRVGMWQVPRRSDGPDGGRPRF